MSNPPEDDESTGARLVCDECGHLNADGQLVNRKDNQCRSRSNAELLAKIHKAKRPTHRPRVV